VKNEGQSQSKEKNIKGTSFNDPDYLLANGLKVKPMASATKLEWLVKKFVNHLHVSILGLFPKCIEKIVDFQKSTKGLGRIIKTPFTTMGIIKNFCNIPHVDNNNSMLSYILWFHANKFLKTIRLISYKSIQQFSKVEYVVE
jgi:hypothetical protein